MNVRSACEAVLKNIKVFSDVTFVNWRRAAEVSEEHIAFVFRINNSKTNLLDPKDGGTAVLRNVESFNSTRGVTS
jgi:hypothetical protein